MTFMTIRRHADTVRAALRHPFLLLLRAYWGWQFVQTGYGKLVHLDRTTEFFAGLGIPFPAFNAMFVGATELAGGAFLLLGLGAGYLSIPLIGILGVAYLTDDHEALASIFREPEKFVQATPFLFLLVNSIVLLFGPGDWSLDGVLRRIRAHRDVNRRMRERKPGIPAGESPATSVS